MENAETHAGQNKDTPPVLQIKNLTKTFNRGKVVALDDVSFTVNKGEIEAVLGPSGCGKTTLMRLIAGLEYPDKGDVLVNGESVMGLPPHRRNIGLVFQDLAVFPHKSIFDNVAFGLRMQKLGKEDIKRRVHDTLDIVELPADTFAKRYPNTLSGGQKQRVAVARTLAMRPSIVLMDEPMAALDRKLRDRMTVELRLILKRLHITVLYVTHDQESASFFSDHVLLMESGRIIQAGTPTDIYNKPNSQFVADFIGTMNFIPVDVKATDASGATVDFAGNDVTLSAAGVEAGGKITLGVRPEQVGLSATRTESSLTRGKLLGWNFYNGTYHYRVLLNNNTEITATGTLGGFTEAIDSDIWIESTPEALIVLKE